MQVPESQLLALRRPLKLDRICFEKVWGGRVLEEQLGIQLDAEGPIGETWELVDREDHNSVVAEGPLAGRTLRSLMLEAPGDLLGRACAAPDGRFPLLVKLLSASRPLSIQVHPDDATAAKLGAGESGKSECWYVLSAEPKSVVYLGLQPGTDAARFAALAAGAEVADVLMPWPVHAGHFVYVPAGTLHAIGEGVALVEVQQNSDLTYRIYDWGRVGLDGRPRELHLEQGLLAVRYEDDVAGPLTPELDSRGAGNRGAVLVDCEHFRVELLHVGCNLDLDTDERAVVYVCTAGSGRITLPDLEEEWPLVPGDTWLLPAAVGPHRVETDCEQLSVLRVDTQGAA